MKEAFGKAVLDEAGPGGRGADPAVRAAALVDHWDDGRTGARKILADQLAEVDKGFKAARKELDGLRRAGAGDTEAPALLRRHVEAPLRRLRDVAAAAHRQAEEVAK